MKSKRKKKKKRLEWSKKLTLWTMIIFISQLVLGTIAIFFDKAGDIFVVSIPSAGGIFGGAVIFYFNKAKIENIFKGKLRFLETRLKLSKAYRDDSSQEIIDDELSRVDDCLNESIDETMKEAVSERIEVKTI